MSTSFGQDTCAFVFLLFKISPSAFNVYSSHWLKDMIIAQHIILLKVIHILYVIRALQQAREEVGQVSVHLCPCWRGKQQKESALWLPRTLKGEDDRFVSPITTLSPLPATVKPQTQCRNLALDHWNLRQPASKDFLTRAWLRNFSNDRWSRSLKTNTQKYKRYYLLWGRKACEGHGRVVLVISMLHFFVWMLAHGRVQIVTIHCTVYPHDLCTFLSQSHRSNKSGKFLKAQIPF